MTSFGGYDDEDPFAQTMGGFGLGGFMNPNRGFSEMYRCYSIAMMQSGSDRDNVSYGGKIILPQSALEKLSRLNISYPMLFKLINAERGVHTHAGVLEFIAEEGRAYLPHWMMQALQVEQGEIIEIKNTSLPLGTFVRIQPQSVDFLDISDPKAVLENAFRNFATLTQGDIIQIIYNNKIYEIKVLEIKPIYDDHGGISIMETDLEVDFAPPVGYVEPSAAPQSIPMGSKMIIDEPQTKPANAPFQGSGQTLKSRAKDLLKDSPNSSTTSLSDAVAESAAIQHEDSAIPAPLNLPFGQLYFGYPIVPLKSAEEKENEVKQNFSGAGQTLRAARKAQSRQGSGTSSPAPQSDGKGKGTR
ncbi:ubiquitin fusion degradation protein [Umbelopsis sp. WA50703]